MAGREQRNLASPPSIGQCSILRRARRDFKLIADNADRIGPFFDHLRPLSDLKPRDARPERGAALYESAGFRVYIVREERPAEL